MMRKPPAPKIRKLDPPRQTDKFVTRADLRDSLELLAKRMASEIVAAVAPQTTPQTAPPTTPPPQQQRRLEVRPDGRVQVPTNLTMQQLRAGEPSAETARRIRLAAEQEEERRFQREEQEYLDRNGGPALCKRYYWPRLARMSYRPLPHHETIREYLKRKGYEK
jgi:hypothetical protein